MNLQQSGTQFIILNSHTYEFEFTYLWIYIWIQNIYIYNSESIHIYIYTWIQFSWFYMIISYVNSYDLMNSYRVWIHTCEFIFIWSFHIWGIKFIWFMSFRWLLSNFSRSSWNLFQVVLGMSCPSWQWHRAVSSWFPVRTLPVAPLWCDLGFFPNSRGNRLRRTSALTIF